MLSIDIQKAVDIFDYSMLLAELNDYVIRGPPLNTNYIFIKLANDMLCIKIILI